jgi:hypothetical protein
MAPRAERGELAGIGRAVQDRHDRHNKVRDRMAIRSYYIHESRAHEDTHGSKVRSRICIVAASFLGMKAISPSASAKPVHCT